MTNARNTHHEAVDFTRWLTDHHHSNYGVNDYVILRGCGEPGDPAGFLYVFAGRLEVDGGTGNQLRALREFLAQQEDFPGFKEHEVTIGKQYWLVIGPAHDGERRALPFVTDTSVGREIKADSGYVYNDPRSVPAAL